MTQTEVYQKMYDDLKEAYDKCLADGKLIFELDGQPYLAAYAKYRLEYLQTLINPVPKEPKRKR